MKGIPYGISDYARIREKNYLYIDKTRFIPSFSPCLIPPYRNAMKTIIEVKEKN